MFDFFSFSKKNVNRFFNKIKIRIFKKSVFSHFFFEKLKKKKIEMEKDTIDNYIVVIKYLKKNNEFYLYCHSPGKCYCSSSCVCQMKNMEFEYMRRKYFIERILASLKTTMESTADGDFKTKLNIVLDFWKERQFQTNLRLICERQQLRTN